jgi:uncharacterized membrane protein YfcA
MGLDSIFSHKEQFAVFLLNLTAKPTEESLFPTSVSIMLPISITTLCMDYLNYGSLPLGSAWPYMLGGGIGGILAGKWAKKIPTLYLHRGLGLLILWGGIRYLW